MSDWFRLNFATFSSARGPAHETTVAKQGINKDVLKMKRGVYLNNFSHKVKIQFILL